MMTDYKKLKQIAVEIEYKTSNQTIGGMSGWISTISGVYQGMLKSQSDVIPSSFKINGGMYSTRDLAEMDAAETAYRHLVG